MAVAEKVDSVQFGTAEQHVTIEVPRAAMADRAGEVRAALAGRRFESAVDVAVCDGDRLVGLVTIETLLGASADAPLASVMDGDPAVVTTGTDQEVAAWKAVHHGASSLAVVDETGRFRGLIPPNRMLSVLLEEHDEDMARLGGYLASSSQARTASEEPVTRRYWHRLPWLLIGLLGAMLASLVVGSFEEQLTLNVELAFFVPGIVYMAGAVGNQTTTLIVRGLSVRVPIRDVIRRELVTGLAMGVTIALLFLPFSFVLFDNADVATAVVLALLAACSTATIVAMTLPWVLARLGLDPAFGAGPLATVVQDLLSILIYFAIVLVVVG